MVERQTLKTAEARLIAKSELQLAVESGTEVRIIPLRLVTKLTRWAAGPQLVMRGAGGEQLKRYGRFEILLDASGKLVQVNLDEVEARRALLSGSAVTEAGWNGDFDQQRPAIKL